MSRLTLWDNPAYATALPLRVLEVRDRIQFEDGRTGALLCVGNYRQVETVAVYEARYWEGLGGWPPEGQCLRAHLSPSTVKANPWRTLRAWQPVCGEASGVAFVPRSWAIHPEDLMRLYHHVESILDPAFKALVEGIFSDTALAWKYLRLPASLNHHHNKNGGLLAHSLEVVDRVLGMWVDATSLERDLLVVAALLHDIGKVRVYRETGGYTDLGQVMHHDDLTLELLAPGLARLEPALANTLRHLLCRSDKSVHYPRSALKCKWLPKPAHKWRRVPGRVILQLRSRTRTTSSKSPLPRPHLNQPDPRPRRSEVSRLEAGYSVDWAAKSRRMAVRHDHWPCRGLADHHRP